MNIAKKTIGLMLVVLGIFALTISTIIFSHGIQDIVKVSLIFIIEVFAIFGGFKLLTSKA